MATNSTPENQSGSILRSNSEIVQLKENLLNSHEDTNTTDTDTTTTTNNNNNNNDNNSSDNNNNNDNNNSSSNSSITRAYSDAGLMYRTNYKTDTSSDSQPITQRKRIFSFFVRNKQQPELNPLNLADYHVTKWDPIILIKKIYYTEISYFHRNRLRKEGHLEALNLGKTKPGLFRRYRNKYLKIGDAMLSCYHNLPLDIITEDTNSDSNQPKPKFSVHLLTNDMITQSLEDEMPNKTQEDGTNMADSIINNNIKWTEGNPILQVRCQKTQKWFSCRASNAEEASDWFETITEEIVNPGYAKPDMSLYLEKNVDISVGVVVEIGSSAVRVGFSGEPGAPLLYFPSVLVTDPHSGMHYWGYKALDPEYRKLSLPVYPFCYSEELNRNVFQPDYLSSILLYIIRELLRITDTDRIKLLLCLPHSWLSHREDISHVIFNNIKVGSFCITDQNNLALYHEPTLTALAVNIGAGIEIIPIVEGCIIESGVIRVPALGGRLVEEYLGELLSRSGIRLNSLVESFVIRYIMMCSCYVCLSADEENCKLEQNPDSLKAEISLSEFNFPNTLINNTLILTYERYECAETLFKPSLRSRDIQGLHLLIKNSLDRVGIDNRTPLAKNILLAGGCSELPGLPERLERELVSLYGQTHTTKSEGTRGIKIHVTANADRTHASYYGSKRLLEEAQFESIMSEQWLDLNVWEQEQTTVV